MVVMIASASLRAAAHGCRQKVATASTKRMASVAASAQPLAQAGSSRSAALAAAGGLAAALAVATTVGRDNDGKVSKGSRAVVSLDPCK
jgi:hypothetical protein